MAAVFFKTVWLIDDDDLSNFINEAILKTQDFFQSVVVFTNVREALVSLDLAIRGEVDIPDIIFLDVEMPGLNGWDFLEAFRRQPAAVKEKCRLYMLTSSIDAADAFKAKQYKEVSNFFVKPITVGNLESIKDPGNTTGH